MMIDRRSWLDWVLKGVTGLYGLVLAFPLLKFLQSGEGEADEKVTQIKLEKNVVPEPGSAKIFKFGSKPGIIIRRPDGSVHALAATCMHLGCTVDYDKGEDKITCACHGGRYDASTGKNLSGPPPAPLPLLKLEEKDDGFYVSKS